MTIFGPDVSQYQAGLKVSTLVQQGFEFLTARCVIGNRVDTEYARFRDESQAAGMRFAAYVFPWTGTPVAVSADLVRRNIGDPTIPVMIDFEKDGSSVPQQPLAAAMWDALKAEGLNPRMLYEPRWYWSQIGSHSLTGRPWKLISSSYGSNSVGHASSVYPGDSALGWAPYGGLTPTLFQFGSRIIVDGYSHKTADGTWTRLVDANAYKGTTDQLDSSGMFTDWSDMPTAVEIADETLTRDGKIPSPTIDHPPVPGNTADFYSLASWCAWITGQVKDLQKDNAALLAAIKSITPGGTGTFNVDGTLQLTTPPTP